MSEHYIPPLQSMRESIQKKGKCTVSTLYSPKYALTSVQMQGSICINENAENKAVLYTYSGIHIAGSSHILGTVHTQSHHNQCLLAGVKRDQINQQMQKK